jgi:hypothetical protein
VSEAEKHAWLALYAAALHATTGLPAGSLSRHALALHAAHVATRDLQALRDLSVEVSEGRLDMPCVVEVLR